MNLKKLQEMVNEEMRSVGGGVVMGIISYGTSLWFAQKISGCVSFFSFVLAVPFTGVVLIVWMGLSLGWGFFRQATSFSEDERNDTNG